MIQVSDNFKLKISGEKITSVVEDLLDDVNYICDKEGLRYFAFDDLLQHAVHYNKALEYSYGKEYRYEVGLLRDEYEKLVSVLDKYSLEKGFAVEKHPNEDINKRYINFQIRISRPIEIETDDFKIRDKFYIEFAPFDRLPESIDTRSAYYRTMQRARHALKFKNECRIYEEGLALKNKEHKKTNTFGRFFFWNIKYGWRKSKRVYDSLQKKAQKYNNGCCNVFQRVTDEKSIPIEVEKLFPVQWIKYGRVQIAAPNDYSAWTRIFAGEDKEKIEKIQKIDLLLLEELEAICNKIGIGYFICGGSMLGYVRHNGFIPWDDDIDVGMLREDYDVFIKEADKYLDHEKFFLQTRDSDPNIPYLFCKIRANNTLYVTEYNEGRDFHKGICLDVFPFDAIPDGEKERKEHMRIAKKRARIHHAIANRQKADPLPEDTPKTIEDKIYRIFGTVHRHFFRAIPLTISQKYYEMHVRKYNRNAKKKGMTKVGSFVPTYTWAEIDTLLPYKSVDFEGVRTKVPNKPEVFLKMQYGNYMQIPPSHEQIGHPLVAWSTDTRKEIVREQESLEKRILEK